MVGSNNGEGEVVVVGGSYSNNLDKLIATHLKAERAVVEFKDFPDRERYVRIDTNLKNKQTIIVQSLYPNQDRALLELMLLIDAALGRGAENLITVVPYLAYSRQDRRFLPGEPISINVILRSLEAVKAGRLLTVDIHKPSSLNEYSYGAINIIPSKTYAKALSSEISDKEVVVIAPDKGALERAKLLAKHIGNVEFDFLEKYRDRITGEVRYKPKLVDVNGKKVIIVDDIISTGGTIAKAARILYEEGAKEVISLCSHGLFVGDALNRIKESGVKRVYAANTIPLPKDVKVIDVSQEIAEVLKNLIKE